MELRDYVRVLRTHWLGMVVAVVLGLLAAAAFTLSQPKVYAANANGFVTAGTAQDAATSSVNDSLAKSRAASYVDLARSRAVADLVIKDLGLDTTPSSLITDITVDQPLDTVLIKITAKASSPALAQRLADAWVRALAVRVSQIEDPEQTGKPGILGVEPVESAALPSSPVSPRPLFNLLVGAILGIAVGIAYGMIRSRLDRRLRDPGEVERRFGVATIGQVPLARARDEAERATTPLAHINDRKNWSTAEAFRKLRTNLSYMRVDDPPRIMVISSPRPGDGKSTTASNLAIAIALSGEDVVLVDADLRRPTVAHTLGLVEGAGLTDVLIGSAQMDDVIQVHGDVPHLAVLAAGNIPPNPSELLSSMAMRTLLAELAKTRIVIIDAPPLLPVTDAAVLTKSSDGAIIVISHGATLDNELEETLRSLDTVKATVLGIVFNRVPVTGGKYAGYYGEYYSRMAEGSEEIAVSAGGRRRKG